MVATESVEYQVEQRDHTPENPSVVGVSTAETVWKIAPWESRKATYDALFGEEGQSGPLVGIIGDGVAGATAAKQLAEKGYRVLVFGNDPGGQAISKIDEVEHHKTRAGGARIVAKGLTADGVMYVPHTVDIQKLPELVEQFKLSGLIVATGGTERLNENVDYSLDGVSGMWRYINRYHEHMNLRKPLAEFDLGLSIPIGAYPEMKFIVQGAGRGVEDIGRKMRYHQAVILAARTGIPLNDALRGELFKGPATVPEHGRMFHNLAAQGLDLSVLGEGFGMHRGGIGDFKWQDPKKHHLEAAIRRVQTDAVARENLRHVFIQNPFSPPDTVVSQFVRAHDPLFRQSITDEVQSWLDGYKLGLYGYTGIVGTDRAQNGRLKVTIKNLAAEFAIEADALITSLGSMGIKLPITEKRTEDGTFVSAHITTSDGRVVPVRLAGMAFNGIGAVGPSTKHAEKVAEELDMVMKKSGGFVSPLTNEYHAVIAKARAMQQSSGFDGDVLTLIVGRPDRWGAFPEFVPQTAIDAYESATQPRITTSEHTSDILTLTSITELSALRPRVHSLKDVHTMSRFLHERMAKELILHNLRDPLTASALRGGYNVSQEGYLPAADMLNAIMGLTQENIIVKRYNIGRDETSGVHDTADYLTLRFRESIDREREYDLRLRILSDGQLQGQKADKTWEPIVRTKALQQHLERQMAIYITPHTDGQTDELLQGTRKVLLERSALMLFYIQNTLDTLGITEKDAEHLVGMLLDHIELHREGGVQLRRGGGTIEQITTDRQFRLRMKQMVERGSTLPSLKETRKETWKQVAESAIDVGSFVLGAAVTAGAVRLTENPALISPLGVFGELFAIAANAALSDAEAQLSQTEPNTTKHMRMKFAQRISRRAVAFFAGSVFESMTGAAGAAAEHIGQSVHNGMVAGHGMEVRGDIFHAQPNETTQIPTVESPSVVDMPHTETVLPVSADTLLSSYDWSSNPSNHELQTLFDAAFGTSGEPLELWKQQALEGWASRFLNHKGWRAPTDEEIQLFKRIVEANDLSAFISSVRPDLISHGSMLPPTVLP